MSMELQAAEVIKGTFSLVCVMFQNSVSIPMSFFYRCSLISCAGSLSLSGRLYYALVTDVPADDAKTLYFSIDEELVPEPHNYSSLVYLLRLNQL